MTTKGQIYNCREAYAEALLSSISGYRQKLLEATAPGAKVSNYVCKHASQADLCAVEQLQILDLWIKHEGLEIGPEGHFYNSLWMSENRSLLDFFGSAPATEGLGGIHKGKFRGKCGLIHLARTILDEDNMRFLHWMAESGMKAQMATGDHKSYMAEQKRKLSR